MKTTHPRHKKTSEYLFYRHIKLKIKRKVIEANGEFVTQDLILPFRRFSNLQGRGNAQRVARNDPVPVENRRYSSLKSCATAAFEGKKTSLIHQISLHGVPTVSGVLDTKGFFQGLWNA